MHGMRKCVLRVLVSGLAMAGIAAPSFATDFIVMELNQGRDGLFVFEPDRLTIKPGDTVTFVAADKGHDVQSIAGLIPAGAQPFKSNMSQDLKVTFTTPGVYAFECLPHLVFGMVGAIVVGAPVNLNALDTSRLPTKAQQRLTSIIGQIKTTTANAR